MHMPERLHAFPPIANRNARILILGSMPGAASLDAGQYYAHPRNAFWPIMGEMFGAGPEIAYEKRLAVLKANGVALWDVLASCERRGSLDSDILREVPNDFAGFFAAHPGIRRIALNGGKAAASFRKHAARFAPGETEVVRLPSTSPAHAARSFAEKCAAWREGLGGTTIRR